MLPFGKQTIEHDDIRAVVEALQSGSLTNGRYVERFETEFARVCGVGNAVAVCNGTAALHATMFAADLGPGDEVIVSAIAFVATANAVLYQSAQPVFADIDPETMLIDPVDVRRKITSRTRAIVAVDFAGQPCEYAQLKEIAVEFDLILISDACHSLGGSYFRKPVGSLADVSCFSLHPSLPVTGGDGGVVTTADSTLAQRVRTFRNHGFNLDNQNRQQPTMHNCEMQELGFNYHLTDLQSALALSQLKKLKRFTQRRNQIAQLYDSLLAQSEFLFPLVHKTDVQHACLLYVVRWNTMNGVERDEALERMRANEIGVDVHYRPVYQQPYYRAVAGKLDHKCPQADAAHGKLMSLPIFPSMTDGDVVRVVDLLEQTAAVGKRTRSAA